MNEQSGSKTVSKMSLNEMLEPFKDLRFAVLATSDEDGPYASLVAFAMTPERHTLVFATAMATNKYRNIKSRPAVSILIDNRSQQANDLLEAQAVTLLGTTEVLTTETQKAKYRGMFTGRHPELAAFVDEAGTALVAVTIRQAIHVMGFQGVSYWP